MKAVSLFLTVSIGALIMPCPATAFAQESDGGLAQPVPDSGPGEDEDTNPEDFDEDILVIAERIRGQVNTDLPPILELDEEGIAAYGADSLADLVAQLAPQISSGSGRGSGRPIFLINGRRVSGFREFRRYPPEAIRKVEILPEEVALQYGFPATQRVINFIIKDQFASRELEIEYGGPTDGGRDQGEIEASLLRIDDSDRLLAGVEFNTASMLTEAERNIIQTPGSVPDVASDAGPAEYRSLAPDTESIEVEGTYNTRLGEGPGGTDISLNGNFQRNHSRSFSGLDMVLLTAPDGSSALRTLDNNPLARSTRTTSFAAGSTLNRPLGDWKLDLTLDASHTSAETDIDRRRDTSALVNAAATGTLDITGPLPSVAGAGEDQARRKTITASSLATLRGTPILLPSGEVSMTFAGGYGWNRIESSDTRTNTEEIILKRGDFNIGTNLGIPIASAREGFLEALGEASLNLGASLNDLSDFGTLTEWTTGITWRPSESLSLQLTYAARDAAPSLSQLGDPIVETFNVPVFDLTNGQSVLATIVTGGNPALAKEKQRDWKLGAYYDLDLFDRASISVEYFRNKSEDVSASFPLLTPEIEAAFPGRVVRNMAGDLTAIDRRPVTYAQRNSSRIRYGVNLFGRIGKAGPRGGAGGAGGFSGGGRRPGGQGSAGAARAGRPAGAGNFDPARLMEMRDRFCKAKPNEGVDLSQLPEFVRSRLTNPDGTVNQEAIAQMKKRFCPAEGGGESNAGPAGGGAGIMFDPERVKAVREVICATPKDSGSPDLSALPEPLLARLRDADGNIDSERLASLRSRICASKPGGGPSDGQKADGQKADDKRDAGPRASSTGRGSSRTRGGFGPFGGGRGRWFLNLYHSVELENTALIAPGVPELDLLDGDTLGSGANSRHTIQLEGGLFHRGVGVRLSGNYLGKGRVDGTAVPGSTTLFYDDIATFNLRLFVNLEQQNWLVGDDPGFLKGTRLSLRANNLFDAHRRITDETGTVPLSFQPGLVDPIGRLIEFEFRKVF